MCASSSISSFSYIPHGTERTPYQTFHANDLGRFVFPFLSKQDLQHLRLTDRRWRAALETYELSRENPIFTLFKDALRSRRPFSFFILNPEEIRKEQVLRELGSGGSKTALEVSDEKALMAPHREIGLLSWKNLVYEEVAVSKIFAQLNLLTPTPQRVSISLSSDPNAPTFPSYLSKTFKSFAKTKGWFIIDTKNHASSSWEEGKHFLFNTAEERQSESNWDAVMDPLLTDIVTIFMYQLPAFGDAHNLAIVEKPSESPSNRYEVRYFGFDFSAKNCYRKIPNIEQPCFQIPYSKASLEYQVQNYLKTTLYHLFTYEFSSGSPFLSWETAHPEIIPFLAQLTEKYSKIVIDRIDSQITGYTM